MTCARSPGKLGVVSGLLLLVALQAAAQATVTTSPPIKLGRPKSKKATFKAEVLHMTRVAITVRSRDNLNYVRTFTYEDKLVAKIGKQLDRNQPFRHGDRVEIVFLEGTDTAVDIKGKPGRNR